MFLVLGRTLKEAWSNFIRNGWLSVAAVTVLLLSLYVISILFVVATTANDVLKNVQNKVNISVYFKPDVSEENISSAQNELQKNSQIKSVDYISRDQALENFKKNNADEPVIIKSLEELGDNPLLASLVVKANDPSKYEEIVGNIGNASFHEDVSRVNYGKNKEVIDKLNSVISEIKKIGLSLAIFFAAISILITFNTIRITIYTHKNEIEVMRLVGASNTFIRLPFIFEGIIYAAIALVISMIMVLITLRFIAPAISSIVPSENLMSVFFHNLLVIIGLELVVGIFLGVISSMIAIRKYLKV